MRQRIDSRNVSFQRFDVLLPRRLDQLGGNQLKVPKFDNLSPEYLIQGPILHQHSNQLLPLKYSPIVGQWLQHVSPEHPSPPMRQAAKMFNKAVGIAFALCVEEDLQLRDRLGVDYEEILDAMPLDAEGSVVEFGFKGGFEVGDQCVECGIGYKFVVRVVVIFIPTLAVDSVTLRLVKHHPLETFECHVSEFGLQLLDQRRVLQAAGIHDFQGVEALYRRDGSQVGQSLNDLAEVDFTVGGVIDSQANLVRTVFDYADDVLADVVFAGRFGVDDIASRPQSAPILLILVHMGLRVRPLGVKSRHGRSDTVIVMHFGGGSRADVVLERGSEVFQVGAGGRASD